MNNCWLDTVIFIVIVATLGIIVEIITDLLTRDDK